MFIKKIIKFFIFVFIVLSPFGVHVEKQEIYENSIISQTNISIVSNNAYAISTGNCNNFLTDATDCILDGVLSFYELLFYTTTQIFVVLSGLLMDAVLAFSISGNFYRQSGIIEVGWEILRDLANVFFIFSLLLISFKMVLGQNDSDNKRNLIKTILVALVINFSLFMSYAIIDGSNILAHVFYNKIESDASNYGENLDSDGVQNDADDSAGIIDLPKWFREMGVEKSVSLAVSSKINPQRIITQGAVDNFFIAFIIVTGMGLMNVLLIYIFLSVTMIFLGRILGLLLLAILSPLALISLTIPALRKQKYIGWDFWLSEILKLSFTAPIFLFFLWLTVSFISNEGVLATLSRPNPNESWLVTIINTYLLLFLIGGLLYLSKKITKDMAGELGNMAGKAAGAAIGGTVAVGAMAATGGMAAAGLATSAVGRGMSGVGKLTGNEDLVNKGRKTRTVGRMAMSTKLDPTKMPGFKGLAGESATKAIASVTGRSALGHIDKTDSFEESEKKRAKTDEKWRNRKEVFNNAVDTYNNEGGGVQGGLAAALAVGKEASGYNKAKKWQEEIIDADSGDKIEAEEKKKAKNDILPTAVDPAGRTLEKFAEDIRKELSESVVVNVTSTPTSGTQIDGAPLPSGMGGGNVSAIPANTSRAQFEDKAIKEYDKDIKAGKQAVKQAERDLSEAQASGDPTRIRAAKSTLTTVETTLDRSENNKEKFEKQTAKKQIEKVEALEKNNHAQAREVVAKNIENSDENAAKRIRNGKVKTKSQKEASKK